MKSFLSSFSIKLFSSIGFVKLGQPLQESYLSNEENKGVPSITSTYIPASLLSQYLLSNAFSVQFS
jgi:hypothetical protein